MDTLKDRDIRPDGHGRSEQQTVDWWHLANKGKMQGIISHALIQTNALSAVEERVTKGTIS